MPRVLEDWQRRKALCSDHAAQHGQSVSPPLCVQYYASTHDCDRVHSVKETAHCRDEILSVQGPSQAHSLKVMTYVSGLNLLPAMKAMSKVSCLAHCSQNTQDSYLWVLLKKKTMTWTLLRRGCCQGWRRANTRRAGNTLWHK